MRFGRLLDISAEVYWDAHRLGGEPVYKDLPKVMKKFLRRMARPFAVQAQKTMEAHHG